MARWFLLQLKINASHHDLPVELVWKCRSVCVCISDFVALWLDSSRFSSLEFRRFIFGFMWVCLSVASAIREISIIFCRASRRGRSSTNLWDRHFLIIWSTISLLESANLHVFFLQHRDLCHILCATVSSTFWAHRNTKRLFSFGRFLISTYQELLFRCRQWSENVTTISWRSSPTQCSIRALCFPSLDTPCSDQV